MPANARLTRRILVASFIGGALRPAAADDDDRAVRITFKDGRLDGPDLVATTVRVPTLRLSQGETVTLALTGDRAATLHLHGYDIEARLRPGEVASLRIAARHAGRFPLEVHGADGRDTTVLYVEVHPR